MHPALTPKRLPNTLRIRRARWAFFLFCACFGISLISVFMTLLALTSALLLLGSRVSGFRHMRIAPHLHFWKR